MSDAAAFFIAGMVCLWLAPAWVWIPLFAIAALCMLAELFSDN